MRIGLTVPEMDITGLYRINGEVFILPLEGGGSFTSKMSTVKATGFSTILPVMTQEGKQVIIFNIRKFIKINFRLYKLKTLMLILILAMSSFK